MTKRIKFIENELDKINNYLSMAQSTLMIPIEICENEDSTIYNKNRISADLIKYLNTQLNILNIRISESKKIIDDFKNLYYEECFSNK